MDVWVLAGQGTATHQWTGQKQANAGPAYLPAPTHQTFIHLTTVFMSHKLNAWQVANRSKVSQIFSPLQCTGPDSCPQQENAVPNHNTFISDNMHVTTVIFSAAFISCLGSSVPSLCLWDVCDLRPFQPFDKIFYYHCRLQIIQGSFMLNQSFIKRPWWLSFSIFSNACFCFWGFFLGKVRSTFPDQESKGAREHIKKTMK